MKALHNSLFNSLPKSFFLSSPKPLRRLLPGIVASLVMLNFWDGQPARSQTTVLDFAPPDAVSRDGTDPGGVNVDGASVGDGLGNGIHTNGPDARATAAVTFMPPDRAPGRSTPAQVVPPPGSVARSPRSSRRPVVTYVPTARQVALFAGGANSRVSRAVGHAEGTRTVDGNKTSAYRGHVDPGNGVWNLGSFSFQHCKEAAYQCSTPEEADVYQLRRLQEQSRVLLSQADQLGLRLTLVEHVNGIDLANQAPLAALGTPGYVALLRAAQSQGFRGSDAILWARTHAYWNPQAQRWDAPGLGNTEDNIRYDQNRRMMAIAAALKFYDLQENSDGQIAMNSGG